LTSDCTTSITIILHHLQQELIDLALKAVKEKNRINIPP
jgi:hypothetical protein